MTLRRQTVAPRYCPEGLMSDKKPLYVTRSYLPPKEEFYSCLDRIYESRILTNQGSMVRELEQRLADYLGVPHLLACSNGTLSLILGLRLAGLSGKKVITTPFTYVATLSTIIWENCTPVFADIDPETLCLSPESLRACLRRHPDAAAVMPVHVYGNACDVEAIESICKEHGLVCLYDSCHTFGAAYKGRSLLSYGDLAVCSFHATKVFHTVEGGCLIVHSQEDAKKLALLRAFGHVGDDHLSVGLNAKMSELHAAMGLTNLPRIDGLIAGRRAAYELYDALLPWEHITRPRLVDVLECNYASFPTFLKNDETVKTLPEFL